MKKTYIIGNWKSNKTIVQAQEWLEQLNSKFQIPNSKFDNVEIVICPSFIHLSLFYDFITKNNLPVKLGVQNISQFEQGAYTGEIAVTQVKGLVSYAIIGHSERRKYFAEENKLLVQKVLLAKECGIEPIFCVQDEKTSVPKDVRIVAYEPVWAIGSGKADLPENANKVCSLIRKKSGAEIMIYGGSVKPENVAAFIQMKHIDGVLPGGASLNPAKFLSIVNNASSFKT